MNKANKVLLALLLCAGTQAFGWIIRFDRNTYGKEFQILTFETIGDYKRMLKQKDIGGKVNDTLLVVTPVVGKVAGAAAVIPDPEFKAAMMAVKVSSTALEAVLKAGLVLKPFNYLTNEGYTIDFYSSVKPSKDRNYECEDVKQLKKHVIHPIKSNDHDIFYVIYDKNKKQVLYADYGKPYGFFTFKLVDIVDQQTGEKATLGNLEMINPTGGSSCPGLHGKELPMPASNEAAPA